MSPDPLLLQAQRLLEAGRWSDARGLLERLVQTHPGQRAVLYALCEAEILGGAPAQAAARLEGLDRASDVEAAFLHARALAALGRHAEARDAFLALRTRLPQPSSAVELHLAAAAANTGATDTVLDALQRAAALDPASTPLLLRLARQQASLGRAGDVVATLRRAVASAPRSAAEWRDIGRLAADALDWTLAAEALERAAAAAPGEPGSDSLAAIAHIELGDVESAQRAIARGLAHHPDDLRLNIADRLLLPPVYRDGADVAAWRARYTKGIDSLAADIARFRPKAQDVFALQRSNFLLAYQGEDDLALQRGYSRFLAALAATAVPDLFEPLPRRFEGGRRLRVGFASSFFRECTIGRYFERWIGELDPRRFERFVYQTGIADDFTASLAARAEHFALLREGPLHAARHIRADDLDVLVYPEIGMDSGSYVLATLRLAPVQLAAWGHPVTTGSDAIDGFLSVAAMEPEGAEAHYAERLLLLPGVGVSYAMPAAPAPIERAQFGLRAGARLYACTQSLFKIHPGMDEAFAAIVAADPEAVLVFFQGTGTALTRRFGERLQRAFARHGIPPRGQVKFMPRMATSQFRGLLATVDVSLDTFHWSGGNTSFDTFAAGTPVVTLPGRFMRGRQTAAMLQAMEIPELVVADPAEFVRTAVALGTDRERNRALRERIAAGRGALVEQRAPLDALAEQLLAAAAP